MKMDMHDNSLKQATDGKININWTDIKITEEQAQRAVKYRYNKIRKDMDTESNYKMKNDLATELLVINQSNAC